MPFAVPQRVLFDDAAGVMSAGQRAISAGEMEIDLAAVTQSDSSLIACLLAWQRAAFVAGKKLTVVNPPASLRGIAALYGVEALAL
jgi:phospholipid transport system transporter-binding protein